MTPVPSRVEAHAPYIYTPLLMVGVQCHFVPGGAVLSSCLFFSL